MGNITCPVELSSREATVSLNSVQRAIGLTVAPVVRSAVVTMAISGAIAAISAGSTSLANPRTLVFGNSNGISFGLSGSTITASGAAGGGGEALSFANSHNVSFGRAGSTITASASFSQSSQPQSAYSFADSNGVSFGTNGSTITASVRTDYLTTAALSNHSHGVSLNLTNLSGTTGGNSAGITISLSVSAPPAQTVQPVAVSAANGSYNFSTLTFANSNGISFSTGTQGVFGTVATNYAATNVTTNNIATANSSLFQHTSATSAIVSDRALSGHSHGNPTLALTNLAGTTASASNGLTLSLSATGQSVQPVAFSASGGSSAFSTLNFADSNGLTFSNTNGSVRITHGLQHTSATSAITTNAFQSANSTNLLATSQSSLFQHTSATTAIVSDRALSTHSHGNPSLNLTNISGTTASGSNGFTLSLSAANPGGAGGAALSAGTQSGNTGTIAFANSNGITFGMSGSSQITASHNALTTAMASNAGSNFVGLNSGLTGNGVSATINSSGISLNVPAFLTTAQPPGAYLTTAAQSNHSHGVTLNLTNINGTTGGNSGGINLSLSAVVPSQTVQTQGMVSLNGQTGALSLGVGSSLSSSVNGVSTTFGLASNITTALQSAGAYLTTAMVSNASTAFAGTGSGFTGGQISATVTHNTQGLSLSLQHPSWLTTAMASNAGTGFMSTAERGNYFYTSNNTFANSTHSHGNPTLNLTNISGTTASNSAGLTLSLSAAAPGAGGGVAIGAGTQTATSGTLVFANSNGVSFGMSGSSQITATVQPGAAAGIAAVNNSNTTYTSGTIQLVEGGGALTIASNTGQRFAFSVPATSSLSGVNLTITPNGNTLSISAAAPGAASDHSHGNPTLALTNISGTTASNSNGLTLSLSAADGGGGPPTRRFIEIMQGERMTSCAALSATQFTNRPMFAPFWMDGTGIQLKTVQYLVSGVGSSNRSFGGTFHAGIYRGVNETQLSLVASDTMSFSITASSQSTLWNGLNVMQFTGMSDADITSEGRYVAAFMVSPVSANSTWMSAQLYGGDPFPAVSRFLIGNTTSATNNTSHFVPFFGVLSTTTAALPNTVHITNIHGGNSASLVDPYVVIREI